MIASDVVPTKRLMSVALSRLAAKKYEDQVD